MIKKNIQYTSWVSYNTCIYFMFSFNSICMDSDKTTLSMKSIMAWLHRLPVNIYTYFASDKTFKISCSCFFLPFGYASCFQYNQCECKKY